MADKHIVIIGAGPGGLTCGMILAKRGYRVTIFEKEPVVGGRNAAITLDRYIFDTGPTFLMMTFILREMFQLAGRDIDDYCKIIPLDPMYQLSFPDKNFFPTADREKMKEQVHTIFPGNEKGYDLFHKKEKVRYEKMYPCLKKPYSTFASLFSPDLLKALPHLSLTKSLFQVLGGYFNKEHLKISFTFQAKYLGMSPWECPGAFAIIPYIEHAFGIDHVEGGLSEISAAMATVFGEHGGELRLNSPVKKILVSNGSATGVLLDNGEQVNANAVVINADFGHAMATLFDRGIIRKYTPEKLLKKKYSCSTFMLYLGVDKLYNESHHNIIIADDYHANIEDIVSGRKLSEDMSVYVRNASVTDSKIAPQGHSALYVLVPVPNTGAPVTWDKELVAAYREKVIKRIESRTSMTDLSRHIVYEKVIAPNQWETDYDLFLGATFNLGHTLRQMLYLRPHNTFEEVGNCYLVGGGTHPGSGLPTIYESARISADLVDKKIKL